ncbi:MAG: NTP transferase domain-containing protein [Gammaproteobacteria bacterium]|nr:NTP transferase domain-containing protein [Gammaproteobacteria bacterium]
MKASGALLAGGQSRRMGADKALLPVGAGTLLDHMLAKLRALDLAEVVVCRDAPGCIADRIPGQGPLGALHSLGIHYPGRDLLIVPVDMPLLAAGTLAALLAASNAAQRPRHYAGYRLPLGCRFPRSDPRDRNAGDRSRRRSLACRAAARTGRGNPAAAPAGNRIRQRQYADGMGAHRAEADRALLIAERRSPGVCENQNAAPDNAHCKTKMVTS